MLSRFFVCLLSLAALRLTAQQQAYFPDPDTSIQRRIAEWQDLKFGLLMHWGAYSQWGIVESWSICPEDLSWATGGRKSGVADNHHDYVKRYEALKTTFNPTAFAPEKWAAAAKAAGMRYVVFTTKHHDGFCMFDSKYTDYKITDPGCPFSANPRNNVTKEVFNAFRKENFWIGAYFSKPDWHSDFYWWKHFPPVDRNCNYSIQKYPERWEMFKNYTHGQIDELMSDYGKIDLLWLDGGWVRPKTEAEVLGELTEIYENSRWARNAQSQDINMADLVRKARKKQPQLIVVDRAVPGIYQNYLTPEQHIPETGLPYPWETCMTMAGSWSHVPNDRYKPTDELVEKLVDIVSKGGNYLLNVGPDPNGAFDSTAYNRLREIGIWMQTNSSAIYGTRKYETFGEGDRIRFTQSKDGRTRFIFLFDFPETGSVALSKMPIPSGSTCRMLGTQQNLRVTQKANGVEITVPASLKSAGAHVWVLKIEAAVRGE